MCMRWTQYWDGPKRHGCSADNKADSLSVRGKVRDSSASMKSFQMEGIKHFLFISCWLSLSPTPRLSTLPLSSSSVRPWSINLSILVLTVPTFHSLLPYWRHRSCTNIYLTKSTVSPNIHIAYACPLHHTGLWLIAEHLACVSWKGTGGVFGWREGGLPVPARPLTDSHDTISGFENWSNLWPNINLCWVHSSLRGFPKRTHQKQTKIRVLDKKRLPSKN